MLYFYYCVSDSASFFFFFQAEDGIRDLTVTGVQTCALPISTCRIRSATVWCPSTVLVEWKPLKRNPDRRSHDTLSRACISTITTCWILPRASSLPHGGSSRSLT